MLLTYPNLDIFNTKAQAIAIPVNCLGVAGAGLAKTCRIKYPAWFADYKSRCANAMVHPSFPMTMYKGASPWLINFPTKVHWEDPSEYEYIQTGLHQLEGLLQAEDMQSVALPKLGCGLGGLLWRTKGKIKGVRDFIQEQFEHSPIHIYLYE